MSAGGGGATVSAAALDGELRAEGGRERVARGGPARVGPRGRGGVRGRDAAPSLAAEACEQRRQWLAQQRRSGFRQRSTSARSIAQPISPSSSFFLNQSSTGHPGPSHAALCPVPLQASQGSLPRPLQAGHSLQPSSSEQNLSEPTVRAPLPRQNSQPQVPEPPQQSHGAEGVFLWFCFVVEERKKREEKKGREKRVRERKKNRMKKKAPLDFTDALSCRIPAQIHLCPDRPGQLEPLLLLLGALGVDVLRELRGDDRVELVLAVERAGIVRRRRRRRCRRRFGVDDRARVATSARAPIAAA